MQSSYGSDFQASAALEKKVNIVSGILGTATMLANVFIIVIFVKDRILRERHLFILRAFGDFFCGVSFAYGGFGRLKAMEGADYYSLISPWDCAMKFYATFQLLGSQLPVIATLMISIERVLAVQLPIWYNKRFRRPHRVVLLLSSVIYCTISLIVYYLSVRPFQQKSTPWQNCALTYSSSPGYNSAHQAFITIVQIAAFCLSSFAFAQARRKSRAAAAMKKEVQSIKPILAISLVSVILVTVPQIYLLSLKLFGTYVDIPVLFVILLLPCVNSFMNIFVYLGTVKEFRQQIVSIICCQKSSNQSTNVLIKPFHIQMRNIQLKSSIGRRRSNQIATRT